MITVDGTVKLVVVVVGEYWLVFVVVVGVYLLVVVMTVVGTVVVVVGVYDLVVVDGYWEKVEQNHIICIWNKFSSIHLIHKTSMSVSYIFYNEVHNNWFK